MCGQHGLPTASVVRSSQATPARRRGQPCAAFNPARLHLSSPDSCSDGWSHLSDGWSHLSRFCVRTAFISKFPVQQVGAAHHTEWWVPAEELEELNRNIVGTIEVVREFKREQQS